MFEQHILGTPADVSAHIARPPRGEFSIVLEGASAASPAAEAISAGARDALHELMRRGVGARDAAAAIAKATGAPKNALYKLAIDAAKSR
jgi:16S rRNA (cytidine1402-2'-O)-methyltransferase